MRNQMRMKMPNGTRNIIWKASQIWMRIKMQETRNLTWNESQIWMETKGKTKRESWFGCRLLCSGKMLFKKWSFSTILLMGIFQDLGTDELKKSFHDSTEFLSICFAVSFQLELRITKFPLCYLPYSPIFRNFVSVSLNRFEMIRCECCWMVRRIGRGVFRLCPNVIEPELCSS